MALLTARKHATQSRSRASVSAILEASSQVLAEDGYSAFNTNVVARRAGVSVGTLYQYFPNKESLLAAVQQKHLDEIASALERAFSFPELSLSAAVERMIEAVIAVHNINPGLHTVLREEAVRLDAKGNEDQVYGLLDFRLRELFEAHRAEIKVRDLSLAAFVVVSIVEGTLHAALRRHPETIKSGSLARELVKAVLGYLSGEGA